MLSISHSITKSILHIWLAISKEAWKATKKHPSQQINLIWKPLETRFLSLPGLILNFFHWKKKKIKNKKDLKHIWLPHHFYKWIIY